MRHAFPAALPLVLALAACVSNPWTVNGPPECARMCTAWNMELVAMVGVGSQENRNAGATACVCQPRAVAPLGAPGAGAAPAASMAAPISAAQAAAAAQAARMAAAQRAGAQATGTRK